MTDQDRNETIERARQLIDDEVLTRTGRSVGDLASGHVARALADAGLLADPAAILNRLAELTEAAGKARSTEWLRLCATLPPSEWPPAPAYKGPMVPAAELEEAHAEIRRLQREAVEVKRLDDEAYLRHREALYSALGCTGPEGSLIVLITENVAAVVAERDLAVWLHVEAKHHLDQMDRMEEHVLTAERDALQARINAALKLTKNPLRWLGVPDELAHEVRAALQGEQPTEACTTCGGRRWEEDKNWSPQYPELWRGERSPGNGLVPCGTCNFGGWNVDPVEPQPTEEADRG